MKTLSQATVAKYLLTIEEAAQALSLGRTHFYKLLSHNEIYTVKIGRSRRVPVVALETFIARQIEQFRKGA